MGGSLLRHVFGGEANVRAEWWGFWNGGAVTLGPSTEPVQTSVARAKTTESLVAVIRGREFRPVRFTTLRDDVLQALLLLICSEASAGNHQGPAVLLRYVTLKPELTQRNYE